MTIADILKKKKIKSIDLFRDLQKSGFPFSKNYTTFNNMIKGHSKIKDPYVYIMIADKLELDLRWFLMTCSDYVKENLTEQ